MIELVAQGAFREPTPGVRALTEEVLRRHGEATRAVVFYGSCLRRGVDEGLVDLYVLVDSYRRAHRSAFQAALNALLPPNVYYLETRVGEQIVRCKYAVVSLDDFCRGTTPRWFHSYLWGRFCQPAGLVYACDRGTADRVLEAFGQAVLTFVRRALPQAPERFTAAELWRRGLELSYRCELRPEKAERVGRIYDDARPYYEEATRLALAHLPVPVEPLGGPLSSAYRARLGPGTRRRNRAGWALRAAQGKVLSVLRLVKAAFTFDGGLDYVLWKIERHSGVRAEVSDRLRRHPILAALVLSWRLYRRGAFR
ncbi:MAG: hypothetical protein Kow0092_17020 [Deferrisomatales bacterium]